MRKHRLLPSPNHNKLFLVHPLKSFVVSAFILLCTPHFTRAQANGTDETANGIPLIYFGIAATNNTSDQCVLAFFEDATPNYEWTFDALKMQSFNPMAVEMALISDDNILLTIDARPHSPSGLQIPIYVKLPSAGNYTFSIGEMANISPAMCLYVEDLITGNTIAVQTGQTLNLNTAQPYTGNRLMLHASPEVTISSTHIGCANAAGGSISVIPLGAGLQMQVQNQAGLVLAESNTSILLNELPVGSYHVHTLYPHPSCPTKTESVAIEESQPAALSISWSRVDACNQAGNGALILQNDAFSDIPYHLWRNDELLWSSNATPGANLISDLTAAHYRIESAGACGQNIELNLHDPSAVSEVQLSSQNILCGEVSGGAISIAHENQPFRIVVYGTDENPIYEGTSPIELNSLSQGIYTLTISSLDQLCFVPTTEIAIEGPAEPLVTIEQIQKADCNQGDTGFFTCSFTGVYSPLMCELSNSAGEVLQYDSYTGGIFESGNLVADVYSLRVISACSEVIVDVDLRDPFAFANSILGGDIEVYLAGNSVESIIVEQESAQNNNTVWTLSTGYESSNEVFEYAFDQPGIYTLALTSGNNYCSVTDSIQITVSRVTLAEEWDNAPSISLIQTGDDLTFVMHGNSQKKIELALLDLSGKIVWRYTTGHGEGKRITTSTNQFARSTYVVMGSLDGEICYTSKVMLR